VDPKIPVLSVNVKIDVDGDKGKIACALIPVKIQSAPSVQKEVVVVQEFNNTSIFSSWWI